LGGVRILAGVAGLIFRSSEGPEPKNVVDAGPTQINPQEEHNVWIPPAAGIAAILAGLGLVGVSRRSA